MELDCAVDRAKSRAGVQLIFYTPELSGIVHRMPVTPCPDCCTGPVAASASARPSARCIDCRILSVPPLLTLRRGPTSKGATVHMRWPIAMSRKAPILLADIRHREGGLLHVQASLGLLLPCLLCAGSVSAQSTLLDLPRQSQHAIVMQRIGVTDITINYHRPLVNGRKIFGGLVPYGDVWRAGANENTTITFPDAVTVEGQPLAAGTYGLHMIPTEDQWTVIFSKMHTAWGSFSYNQEEDALRVTVKPEAAEFHEALAYDFDQLKPDSAVVTMRWDKVAVLQGRSQCQRSGRGAAWKSRCADWCSTPGTLG